MRLFSGIGGAKNRCAFCAVRGQKGDGKTTLTWGRRENQYNPAFLHPPIWAFIPILNVIEMHASTSPAQTPLYIVKNSKIHGTGVFAARKIPAQTYIIEYAGQRISDAVAAKRGSSDPDNPYHTFFFSLENGRLIDGGVNGNESRWINHACAPNCEAREENGRVFIVALRDIRRGEELNYDYGLVIDARHTAALKQAYACYCGASTCRHTMLAPKRKKRA